MRSKLHTALFTWAVALSMAVLTCTDEDHGRPCDPRPTGGVIEGRVATGEVPTQVRVIAIDTAHRGPSYAADADSSGDYRLEVPVGLYALAARVHGAPSSWVAQYYYAADGPPYPSDQADTLVVTADAVIIADFELSSLELEVAFPAWAEGSLVEFLGLSAEGSVDPQGCPRRDVFSVETEVRDGKAAVALGGLEPGSRFIRMWLMEREAGATTEQLLWLPGTRSCAEAETIQIPVSGAVHRQMVLSGDAAHLTGSIAGSWRELSSYRPQITLVTADSSAVLARITPSVEGTFAADILAPEGARMLIDIHGSRRWYPRGSFAESEVLDLTPGASLPPVEIVESGLILGIGFPLHHSSWQARVQLIAPEDSGIIAEVAWSADYSQPFHGISNLDPGDYWLRILPDYFLREAWRPQWYDRAPEPGQATLVHVPPDGGVGRVDITLEEGGRVEGSVWYENTPETHGVLIYVTSADDPATVGRIPPGGGGMIVIWQVPQGYALLGLPDGNYKVGVWPRLIGEQSPAQPPTDTVWYPETTDWNAAQVLTIAEAQVIAGIDFDLR